MPLFTVSATKPSPESKVGVTFAIITEDGDAKVVLKSISETSIFADTAACPGYELVKYNGTPLNADKMSIDDVVDLVKASEGEVTMLLRERFGETATATIEKTSSDMKTGMFLSGNKKVFIKEFVDTSPFKGKLPIGKEYFLATVNDVNVKNMSANDIVQVIGDVPKGESLTITMEKNPAVASVATVVGGPPPGLPAGGDWGQVKYVGNSTGMAACLGCLCFGIPGLLVLCCPCDEKDVYRVNGKLYLADGRLAGEPANKFIPQGPRNQNMAR